MKEPRFYDKNGNLIELFDDIACHGYCTCRFMDVVDGKARLRPYYPWNNLYDDEAKKGMDRYFDNLSDWHIVRKFLRFKS